MRLALVLIVRTSVAVGSVWCATVGARAQDLEPRAFSASPVGTNFLVGGYVRTSGNVSLDPSLPITGLEATINAYTLGYQRTFAVADRVVSAGIILPYLHADLSGLLDGQPTQTSRTGLGDLRLRFSANLIGNPPLSPAEFAERPPSTTLGASLSIVAPTGQYDSTRAINISANRWAFKTELGVSQPFGNWFAELSTGSWFFTDNTNFFNGNVRSQAPLWDVQVHAGYNFRPGLWLAADGTYYGGGETSINGVAKHDAQLSSRYGLTLAIPVFDGVSVKFSWASWLTSHNGGSFDTFGVQLQYRWFD